MTINSRRELADRLAVAPSTIGTLIKHGVLAPFTLKARGSEDRTALHRALDDVAVERALESLKWLAIVTPDSWRRLIADGLHYTLLAQRYSGVAGVIRPGNKILFYVSRYAAFVGLATVSERVQRRVTVWPRGIFHYRVPLHADSVSTPIAGVRAKGLVAQLDFISRKESWEQYFRTTIRLIHDRDFELIRAHLVSSNTSSTTGDQK